MHRYILLLVFIGLAWGQDCTADDGTDGVELWGECYSIENTTELNLVISGLTGEIPSEIGNLTNLTSLQLSYNQLSGIIPDEICNQGYSSLNLSNNQLCPPYPSCVEEYVGGQDQCSCGFDDDDMVYLWGNCYSIEYTTELNLFISGLTGEIPSEIGNLTNLTYLSLGINQLTGEIPSEIGNLTNLTNLSLGVNQLTGEIPSEIGNLTNLTSLDLHNNQLTGSIPPEIGNLNNLEILNLKNNELTGTIPPEIGNLTNLIALALQDNQLSGIIPDEICNQGANSPNLSNNQLCPPYPSCVFVGDQDTSGCGQVSIIDETLPITYNLYNAYPNPFNPITTLRYDLPEDAVVNITIYDMMGRIVKTLVNSSQTAGYKSVQWNATNGRNEPVSAGLYLYTIEAGKFRQTKKMVLLK